MIEAAHSPHARALQHPHEAEYQFGSGPDAPMHRKTRGTEDQHVCGLRLVSQVSQVCHALPQTHTPTHHTEWRRRPAVRVYPTTLSQLLLTMEDADDSPAAVLGASEVLPRPAVFAEEPDTDGEGEVFDELLCPLASTLMHDPVSLPCGHSFSRSALVM